MTSNWPEALKRKGLLLFALAGLVACTGTAERAGRPVSGLQAGIVAVDGGRIQGTRTALPDVWRFGSVPYAAPPVGRLRWRPPQSVPGWGNAIRRADRLPPQCVQVPLPPDALFHPLVEEQSEDCLYLNIWTAAADKGERRPVMLWLHGGGFMQGSSALAMYDGAAMARRGVVFVSVNYRLGALGYLALPALSAESPQHVSGNYGTLDQIEALRWIGRNIAQFGGDPGNVTVIGQSAGSMSLNLLTASPLAAGLFHKGIGETGAVLGMLTSAPLAQAEAKGERFAQQLGAASIGDLRAMDAHRLAESAGTAPGTFEPIADGWVLPAPVAEIYRAGAQNDVPLLIGSNADENPIDPTLTLASYRAMLRGMFGPAGDELLALYPAADDEQAQSSARRLMTVAMAQYPMRVWAGLQRASGKEPLYMYRFTRVAPVPPATYLEQRATPMMGAWHGAEIHYALDNLAARTWPWTADDRRLADIMARYWVNFASSGNPNGLGLPEWPVYASDPARIMELGDHVGPIVEPNAAAFSALDRAYGNGR